MIHWRKHFSLFSFLDNFLKWSYQSSYVPLFKIVTLKVSTICIKRKGNIQSQRSVTILFILLTLYICKRIFYNAHEVFTSREWKLAIFSFNLWNFLIFVTVNCFCFFRGSTYTCAFTSIFTETFFLLRNCSYVCTREQNVREYSCVVTRPCLTAMKRF